MSDLQNFLDNCNNIYSAKYLPKFKEELEKIANFATDINSLNSNYMDLSLRMAQYISLNNLKEYHNWLAENYNITPKN